MDISGEGRILWSYYLSRDLKDEKESAMSKTEGIAGEKAPERWPGWCEDIAGKGRR